jgi:hypothetical protein
MVTHTHYPSYVGGIGTRITVQVFPWTKTRDCIQKLNKAKSAQGVAQVVGVLISRQETLSSDRSTSKK